MVADYVQLPALAGGKIDLTGGKKLFRRVERQRRQGECEDWGVFSSRIGHLPTIHKRAARA